MDILYVRPTLDQLDLAGTEVLIAAIASNERPPHGLAGLVDWRLAGRLSRLIKQGFITGRVGEVTLVPGKPKLPFDKVLLFGVGSSEDFSEQVYRNLVPRILTTLEGLHARSAVVELPGRHFNGLAAEKAADIVLELSAERLEHDVWTLVESAEAQKTIEQHMIQQRRRVRRL